MAGGTAQHGTALLSSFAFWVALFAYVAAIFFFWHGVQEQRRIPITGSAYQVLGA